MLKVSDFAGAKGVLLALLVGCFGEVLSQENAVSIRVKAAGGRPVENASVRIDKKEWGADSTGIAVLLLPKGNYKVLVSAVGHHDTVFSLQVNKDISIDIPLRLQDNFLQGVVVTANRNILRNQMSTHRLDISQIQKLPVILGEVDPIKTITLLPGIKNGGEAGAGIYVRGGGPDQNLVLLDGIQVYNPNHLLGFFSVFNGDAIKNLEVIKGGIPAEYGGRLSSVIAINTKEGNKDSLKLSGGIGLISSRLSLEGPIIKGKSSFSISGRRTYVDQVAKLFAGDTLGNNGYFFYDINAKMDFAIDPNNTIGVTFYAGRDKFTFASDDTENRNRQFNAVWGNTILGVTWKQQLSKKLRQELLLVRNDFNLDTRISYGTSGFLFSSGLTDYQVKNDWQFTATDNLRFKAGVQYMWHSFRPGAGSSNAGSQEFKSEINDQYAREAAAYMSADIDISSRLNLIAGLRYSYFNQVGPTERIIYAGDGTPTGEVESYGKGESIANYSYPEPRLNILYRLSDVASLKMSYTRTVQYLHLATTSAATFPSDLWVPSSKRIQPGIADQIAAGYFRSFKEGTYELSAEAYYKTMNNQLEFRPGAELLLNQNLEGEMIFGSGKAYGLELFLQKRKGRLTGWIGYTISRTERTFPEMNSGKPFPYRYDRTHDLSVVANYQLSKKWDFSGVFVYGTGNALTMPSGRFVYNLGYNFTENRPVFTNIDQYAKINDYRMPAYHRMDIAFTYTPKPNSTRRYKSSWVFSLYNLYSRRNPYFIYLDVDEEEQTLKGKQVFLFPIIPGITWNFKF